MRFNFIATISILLFTLSSASAQKNIQLPLVSGKVTFTDTVFINNTPKTTLYHRAKNWINTNFTTLNKDFNEVNKSDSLMVGNGFLEFSQMDLNNLNQVAYDYKIQIEVYDNAYVYKLYNFKGKLYEKSQYSSTAAARISVEEDYANYQKNYRMHDYTRRIKLFYKLINQQIESLNKNLELQESTSVEYERGPHLE